MSAAPVDARLRALGSFRLEAGPAVVEKLPTRKATAILAHLALFPRPHAREALIADYWPDMDPNAARTSLRQALAMIRRALPETAYIEGDQDCVRLRGVVTDVADFRSQAERAVVAPEAERADQILATLRLYAEPLLPGWEEDWVVELRADLESSALDLMVQLAGLLAPDHPQDARIWTERALEIEPDDEDALALLDQLDGKAHGSFARFTRRPWPVEREGTPVAAPIAAGEAIERFIRQYFIQDPERAVEMLSYNEELLMALGYRRVLPLYVQAAKIVQPASPHYGRLWLVLGQILHRIGRYDRANTVLNRVADWAREHREHRIESMAMNSLSLVALERSNRGDAHHIMTRLRDIEGSGIRQQLSIFTRFSEGAHRWHMGDPRAGRELISEAIRQAIGDGQPRAVRWNLANYGMVSYELGAVEAMQEALQAGRPMAESFADRYLEYGYDYLEGLLHIAEGNFNSAIATLNPLRDDPRQDFGRCRILIGEALGYAAALDGKSDLALEVLGESYVIRRRQGHLPTVTERRNLRKTYGLLEDEFGTTEVDRRLDRSIGDAERRLDTDK